MTTTIHEHRDRLAMLTIDELRLEYENVCGEMTTSRHRVHLIKRILWQMQANQHGGLTQKALKRAAQLADTSQLRLTAPRGTPLADNVQTVTRSLPLAITTTTKNSLVPGTQVERMYKGQKIVVTIMENGVRYNGDLYRSLSAVAKTVTGTHWNGKLFFGLTKKKEKV